MPTVHPQTITKPNGETFTFNIVEVEGGIFEMGEFEFKYRVKLDTFLAAEYLVTQDLYEFVTGENPSFFLGKRRPVEVTDWYDAVEFCNSLSEIANLKPFYTINKNIKDPNNLILDYDKKGWLVESCSTSNGFRLPTEAEWEYAARGGEYWEKGFEFAGSNNIKKVGWYDENSHNETVPVGLKVPNQFGLYDLSGNVHEWCFDWYDKNHWNHNNHQENSIQYNPLGAKRGREHVIKGGSWKDNSWWCKNIFRRNIEPPYSIYPFGFRIFRNL